MIERLSGREIGKRQETKYRPVRVANKFASCPFSAHVVTFYQDELGADSKELTLESSWERFIELMKSGQIYPEALYLSCTSGPFVGNRIAEPERFQKLEEPYFDLILKKYVPQAGFKPQGPVSVLSLACGVEAEAGAINKFFSGSEDENVRAIHVGIDSNKAAIEDARFLYKGKPGFTFINGDLRDIQTKKQLENIATEFDMIIMRHAPIAPAGDLWMQAVSDYSKYLKKDGLLMMTFYHGFEFEEVRKVGLPDCYKIQICERNKARAFNRAIYGRVMMMLVFSSLGGEESLNAEPVENVMNMDQYIIMAIKK